MYSRIMICVIILLSLTNIIDATGIYRVIGMFCDGFCFGVNDEEEIDDEYDNPFS